MIVLEQNQQIKPAIMAHIRIDTQLTRQKMYSELM